MELRTEEGRVPGRGAGRTSQHARKPHSRMWGSGGVVMGRKSKMLELVATFEG